MLRYWESNKTYDGSGGAPPWRAATLGASTLTVALPPLPAEEEPNGGVIAFQSVVLAQGGNLVGWGGPLRKAQSKRPRWRTREPVVTS